MTTENTKVDGALEGTDVKDSLIVPSDKNSTRSNEMRKLEDSEFRLAFFARVDVLFRMPKSCTTNTKNYLVIALW